MLRYNCNKLFCLPVLKTPVEDGRLRRLRTCDSVYVDLSSDEGGVQAGVDGSDVPDRAWGFYRTVVHFQLINNVGHVETYSSGSPPPCAANAVLWGYSRTETLSASVFEVTGQIERPVLALVAVTSLDVIFADALVWESNLRGSDWVAVVLWLWLARVARNQRVAVVALWAVAAVWSLVSEILTILVSIFCAA